MKRIVCLMCAMFLIFNISVSFGATSKDEIIYMNINSDGALKNTYIVNVFGNEKEIVDYGKYDSVKNLTNSKKISINDDEMRISNNKGKFYYQGNLKNAVLPWIIDISYYLDGNKIEAKELISKNGKIKIEINTKKNEDVYKDIFNNFSMQISVSAYSDKIKNIKSENANIVYAGSKTTFNYIVLPKRNANIELEFDAKDFELDEIRFVAVPFKANQKIEIPNFTAQLDKISDLKNGVGQLKYGTSQLSNGTSNLYNGTKKLSSGSKQFKSGLNQLASGSKKIKESSDKILKSINELNTKINGSNNGSIDELIKGSKRIKHALSNLELGINEYSKSFSALKSNSDFEQLKNANISLKKGLEKNLEKLNAVPEKYLKPIDITKKVLMASEIEIINKTLIVLNYLDVAKENTYLANNLKANYKKMSMQLKDKRIPLKKRKAIEMELKLLKQQIQIFEANNKAIMAKDEFIKQLELGTNKIQSGITTLNKQYSKFDNGIQQVSNSINGLSKLKSGIVTFANEYSKFNSGVTQIYKSQEKIKSKYNDLDSGVKSVLDGVGKLDVAGKKIDRGVSQLNNGLSSFNMGEVNKKIDKIKKDYQFDDYVVKSFVSNKNTDVKLQQFVISTPALQKEKVKYEKHEKVKMTLLEKVKAIFR